MREGKAQELLNKEWLSAEFCCRPPFCDVHSRLSKMLFLLYFTLWEFFIPRASQFETFHYRYGFKIVCLPPSYVEILIPKESGIRRWGLQEVLRSYGRKLHESDQCFYKGDLTEIPSFSTMLGHRKRVLVMNQPEGRQTSQLPRVCGILLQEPKWTKYQPFPLFSIL